MPINGVALSSVAIGSILIWSGVKGWNFSRTIGEIVTGNVPKGSEENVLTTPGMGGVGGASVATGFTSSGIANDALKYQGHAYLFGGAPGKNGANPWDCSSFVNWVCGHDLGKPIPGYGPGQYDGSVHGPPTGSWAAWPGLKSIPLKQAMPGDIIIWVGHMGIVIGPNQMISARSTSLKTSISSLSHGTPLMKVGRYQ
jgi:cell wall-associated NlpC family hydrolase